MVTLNTYLLQSGKLVPVEFATRAVRGFYIYGSIELTVGSIELLTCDQIDLVDQLWSYIVEGLPIILSGSHYETYFADSPIKCEFLSYVDQRKIVVNVIVNGATKSVIVDRSIIVNAMKNGAMFFFTHLSRVATGKNLEMCNAMISKILAIET